MILEIIYYRLARKFAPVPKPMGTRTVTACEPLSDFNEWMANIIYQQQKIRDTQAFNERRETAVKLANIFK